MHGLPDGAALDVSGIQDSDEFIAGAAEFLFFRGNNSASLYAGRRLLAASARYQEGRRMRHDTGTLWPVAVGHEDPELQVAPRPIPASTLLKR